MNAARKAHKVGHLRALVSFLAVVIVFLVLGDFLFISQQREMLLSHERQSTENELRLMGTLVREALLRSDYATVEQFLTQWGDEHREILGIRAVAPNGFVLKDYPAPAGKEKDAHRFTQDVAYSGKGLLRIELIKDFGPIYGRMRRQLIQSVAISIIYAAILGIFLWFTLRRTALVPMEVMLEEVNQRVRERTRELADINDELEDEIGERRAAESRLQRSEEYLRAIFRAEPECVKLVDPEGTVLEMNQAGIEMLEADSADRVIGMSIFTFVDPEYREAFRLMLDDVCAGQSRTLEYRATGLGGTARWLESHSVPFHDEVTKQNVMLSITRDNTTRHRLEDQLRHSQKMEAIGTLTGGIAHEFNNILMAIMGYGELLGDALPEDPQLKGYLDMIQKSAKRAVNITGNLLAYSRKEAVMREPRDVNEVVRGSERLISTIAKEGISVVLELSDAPMNAMLDAGQMEQVVINLAINAMDAMPAGGTLTIRTEPIDIDDEFVKSHGFGSKGPNALVSVTDTGVGMNRDVLSKVFEPFFTTKQVGKGTGLGLSIAYGIIKAHGGHINVYSEPGRGTTFRIYLPLIEYGGGMLPGEEKSAEAEGGTETILLAEDDQEVRGMVSSVLARAGYRVIEAVDGKGAVEEFRKNGDVVDMLLFDLVMPGMDGREAYEEISRMRPGVRVLFMSGYSDDVLKGRGVDESETAGAYGMISKPVSPRALLLKIRETLKTK